jgi:3-phenylpropionate/trans-cinnamate dioxygenase ferredoxin reductase subunit
VADIETDVLLIGGGVASVRCARTLRRNGFDGSILLVGDEGTLPYNRPPLSKELLRDDLDDELALAEQPAWYERNRVTVLTRTTVTRLDLEARAAELWDGTRVAYGWCLLATGAAPRTLPVPGGVGVPTLRTLADARRLRATATQLGPGAAVTVVGGGLIGVEVGSSLAALGLRPTLVARGDRLWDGALGDALSDWATARLEEAGVAVRLGSEVTEIADGRAVTADGPLDGPAVLAGIGVDPRVGLAAEAGLTVDDGIVTDEAGRTSDPAVWAAGDVARSGPRRVEHWHHARESGERAALSMLGLPVPAARAPWSFSEVGGIPFDVIGDGVDVDAEEWARPASVLLRASRGRVVQVAIVAGATDVGAARELVERGASVREARRGLAN